MRFVHHVVCCIYLGVFPKAKIESGVGTIEVIQPAVPTKRKVIGTIQNTRLLFLGWRVCVLVHTSASLQNARSRFHRIQRQPAAPLRSLFSFSLSPSPYTHALSLPRPPTPDGYIFVYWRRSAAPIRRCSLSAALRVQSSSSTSVQTFD